jgi:hypothetical protein
MLAQGCTDNTTSPVTQASPQPVLFEVSPPTDTPVARGTRVPVSVTVWHASAEATGLLLSIETEYVCSDPVCPNGARFGTGLPGVPQVALSSFWTGTWPVTLTSEFVVPAAAQYETAGTRLREIALQFYWNTASGRVDGHRAAVYPVVDAGP